MQVRNDKNSSSAIKGLKKIKTFQTHRCNVLVKIRIHGRTVGERETSETTCITAVAHYQYLRAICGVTSPPSKVLGDKLKALKTALAGVTKSETGKLPGRSAQLDA